ncbi:MAG: hypothetical protein HYX68_01320 [Planctomycetes bacterium]|nr:hypothetical protein [Planctomycetota bacterium]
MRNLLFVAVVFAWGLVSSVGMAQDEKKPPAIKKVQIGFQSHRREEATAIKVGMWAPIYIEVFGGTDGIDPRTSYLEIQAADSEGVGTQIRMPIAVKALESRTVMTYVKAGHMTFGGRGDAVTVALHYRDRKPIEPKREAVDEYATLQPSAHLYLALGQRMPDVNQAARHIDRQPGEDKEKDFNNFQLDQLRQAVFETDVKRLPDAWFGYNGIDLIVLSTENKEFLLALNNNRDRLKALAQWVRRGGRLVVPINHASQPLAAKLLNAEFAWQPPIPVVPPSSAGNVQELALRSLPKVANWANVQEHEFKRVDPKNPQRFIPIEVARLDDGKVPPGAWEVYAEAEDGRPLITRVRYGLGQIVYLAFSFDDVAFQQWPGKDKFLQAMLTKLGPRAPEENPKGERFMPRGDTTNDLATQVIEKLDNFDVTIIPFGYVALFIVLYILVVGPLDFFLLKYVFKRLEWTWITFPAVVLAVSVIAYFAAYALKGRDLKINKVDIVDFDLRTSRDGKQVTAYGNSFFTILSPRIQNYTVGLEPNPAFWGDEVGKVKLPGGAEKDEVLSADLVSWLGRPSGGPNDFRRSGSTGFFRKPYEYTPDMSGLVGVPIPVWTTKAFCATWEQPVKNSPFTVDLTYHTKEIRGKDLKITGTLDNHLGVELSDVWIIYQNRCYPIPGGMKSVPRGGKANAFAVPVEAGHQGNTVREWVSRNADEKDGKGGARLTWNNSLPETIKTLMFHERFDIQGSIRNHSFRMLEQGWRITEEPFARGAKRGMREAILVARVAFASDRAETLNSDEARPIPTRLWLGDIPDPSRTRPGLIGQMNQETYVRVILPVRPGDE